MSRISHLGNTLISQEAEVTTELSNLHSQHLNTHRTGGEDARTTVGPLDAGKKQVLLISKNTEAACPAAVTEQMLYSNSSRIDAEAAPCSLCL